MDVLVKPASAFEFAILRYLFKHKMSRVGLKSTAMGARLKTIRSPVAIVIDRKGVVLPPSQRYFRLNSLLRFYGSYNLHSFDTDE